MRQLSHTHTPPPSAHDRSPCQCIGEILNVVAGTVDLDAHTSLLTLVTFLYFSFPSGVGQASTVRVGSLLGAGQPARARMSGRSCRSRSVKCNLLHGCSLALPGCACLRAGQATFLRIVLMLQVVNCSVARLASCRLTLPVHLPRQAVKYGSDDCADM